MEIESSCSTQALNTYKTFEASNFDGEWVNDAKLAISSVGHVDQGTVGRLDVGSGAITTIIQATGSPAGITTRPVTYIVEMAWEWVLLEQSKHSKSEWMAPLSESVINFESSGTLVANLLSAAFLGFDKQGNLYVGGGDFGYR